MEAQVQEEAMKPRLVKVDSQESWDLFMSQAKSKAVVHFTAAWCMPSVAMKPLLEDLAFAHQDILFLSVDVDEVKEVASKMEIKAMPTLLLLSEGAQVDKLVGANPEEIKKRIDGFVHSFRALNKLI